MARGRQRVAVLTGSRADFGLLAPVMRAVDAHPELELVVFAAGAHLIGEAPTKADVAAQFEIAAEIPMQESASPSRLDDARALGRGIQGCAEALERHGADWIVVLGDRIEALAGAAAGSVGGVAVAHLHGGDRAEGVADEAMRHAITKLAHLHLPATRASAERIERMGEARERIVVVGSPALDDLEAFDALDDARWDALGSPEAVVLFHPIGDDAKTEAARTRRILEGLEGRRVLALQPNHDPGREGVAAAIRECGWAQSAGHLARREFIGLLKRLGRAGGVLVGNSSSALIEAAALGVRAVDVGERQSGRERAGNVVWTAGETAEEIREACERARRIDAAGMTNPYGDGRAGERAVEAIVSAALGERRGLLRKRNSY